MRRKERSEGLAIEGFNGERCQASHDIAVPLKMSNAVMGHEMPGNIHECEMVRHWTHTLVWHIGQSFVGACSLFPHNMTPPQSRARRGLRAMSS